LGRKAADGLDNDSETKDIDGYACHSPARSFRVSISHSGDVRRDENDIDSDIDDMDTGGRRASLRINSSHGEPSASPQINVCDQHTTQDKSPITLYRITNSEEMPSCAIPSDVSDMAAPLVNGLVHSSSVYGQGQPTQFLWQPWSKCAVNVDNEPIQSYGQGNEGKDLPLKEIVPISNEIVKPDNRLKTLRLRREHGVWTSQLGDVKSLTVHTHNKGL